MSKILSFGKGLSVSKIKISVFDRVEDIVEKGENAGFQDASFSVLCVKFLLIWSSLKNCCLVQSEVNNLCHLKAYKHKHFWHSRVPKICLFAMKKFKQVRTVHIPIGFPSFSTPVLSHLSLQANDY